MAFTFANINNRSALIQGQAFFDLALISAGSIPEEPMEAIKHNAMLHQYAEQLDE